MARKHYVTREEFQDFRTRVRDVVNAHNLILIGILALGTVAVSGFLILYTYFPDTLNLSDPGLRSFLAAQYNFTESECISRAEPHLNADCAKALEKENDFSEIESICRIPDQLRQCLLYCHTIQISDGQDCKTEELVGDNTTCSTSVFLASVGATVPVTVEVPSNRALDFQTLNQDYNWTCNKPSFNRTTCTPRYRNVTTLCATPEQIAQARELVK